jgi:hypothetical protein
MVKLNKAAKEINDRYMRFVEWLLTDCYCDFVYNDKCFKWFIIDEINNGYTTEDIFQYWQDKIEKK